MTFLARACSSRARLTAAALMPALVAVTMLATGATGSAQRAVSTGAHDAPLTQPVPVDPRITVGTLPNGMRYYIRKNTRPAGRAELRLAVKAGSILEDDDQRGLAHFVEHMAFNGTEHFPKQDVVAFLQSTGMRFGAHINANTSFDQTVYQLTIPTEKTEVIDRSLLILEDWARAVSFEPEEIDKERGVILEEWRTGLGARARILEAQLPVLLKGSRYAERLPIGNPETLRTFPNERLKKFYTDWYRPDLMAVIVVGDFDPAVVEPMIRAHFGAIPMPASPRPRPSYEVPEHPGTRYTVATDPEASGTTVSVATTMTARDQTTIGAYRQGTLERVFSGLLSARLSELSQKPDAPFLDAGTSRSLFVQSAEMTMLNALVADGGVEKALAALFTENDRVARFGFTQTELDRYRQATMQAYAQLAATREEHLSNSLADEFVRNFMQDEPIPGIAYENALVQRFLPEITLAEVNALAREWMPDRNRVVAVSAPKKEGVAVPDEKTLAAVIKSAGGDKLTAYVDTVSTKPLLEPLPKPGKVAKETTKSPGTGTGAGAATGITEWTLSNGVRVVLQPTTFKQDEILFNAFSPGGTSLASDKDFVPAETADQVVAQGGLGTLNSIDLGKKLAGKTAIVRASIGDMSEGLGGRSLGRDLETMFQLIYLTFTQPRADAEAFNVMKGQLNAVLANRQARPETAFADALNAAVSQDHLRARPMSPEVVAQMDLAKSMAFYKDRFADASDFTFVFVGSFDLATMKPLVERYLGSLPSLKRKEAGRDVGIRPPTGVVEKTVTKGREPRSQVGVVFTGPFKNTRAERLVVRTLADTLEGSLQRVLREDLGGTYGVSVEPDYSKQPAEEYRLTISFTCDPARTGDLVKALFQVIDDFKTDGPSSGQLADVRAALLRDLETDSQQNGFVLRQLAYAYEFGEEVPDLAKLRASYEQLTPAMIRDAARTYLDTNRYVKVVLMPEGQPAPAGQ
jgi:zinc protease